VTSEDVLRERVEEFETIVEEAKRAIWAREPKEVADAFLKDDPVLAWDLLAALDSYRSSSAYPQDRLPGIMHRLIDTKLQMYFVSQVVPGAMNQMVYLRGFDPDNPLATPNLQLTRLSYLQALIGQSRVLWERLMRLIYFLETGSNSNTSSRRTDGYSVALTWDVRRDGRLQFSTKSTSH
jgi:hypothetical protein